jgi:glyoxylase-like metal-dependent hydrolase (beta-lactamase superfamily II)
LVKGVADIEEVGSEAKMVQCGGHFDGSSVLWWEKKLFIADTFMSVPVSPPITLLLLLGCRNMES